MNRYFNSALFQMSIINKKFSTAIFIFVVILLGVFSTAAQRFEAKIRIVSDSEAIIEGKILDQPNNAPIKNWSFSNPNGAADFNKRIADFVLFDREKQIVPAKKLASGEFFADARAESFQYRINLNPLPDIKSRAHVSWLGGEKGILMLDDLLPRVNSENQAIPAKIEFDLPAGWKVFSSETPRGANISEVKNTSKAIFAVGKNWRETETPNFKLALTDDWQFSDAEAAQMAAEIIEAYRRMFNEMPPEKIQILLARFPRDTKFGRWEAETRGATVTILSSDMPFRTTSLQRLHEQMRHEIFHLWMPNDLALTGNYDWFYEGFTVYKSLRTGLAMNQIRFEDFLATLGEAFDAEDFQNQKISLLEASKNSWNRANSNFYARGMLVAFLCDAAILKESGGKRSIDDVFQRIYRDYRVPNKTTDGNAAILKVLKSRAELVPIVENYVEKADKINWETALDALGIETRKENLSTKLSVKPKLKKSQKDLLNELGYNNWRKIGRK